MSEQWERNLQRVVRRIALEQADGERILRQHMMRRQALIRRRYSGAALMNAGLPMPLRMGEYPAYQMELNEVRLS